MPLSWTEIKARAIAFSREWAEETRETAEAKSFWDAFFNVFGLSRRAVAVFEEPVRSLQGSYNRIDLFWKGRLLAEHKSAGKDLGKAKGQAFDYVQDLLREGRHAEVPDYIATTDFARLQLYDLNADGALVADFPLKEFHRHVKHFAFIAGYRPHAFAEEPAVNVAAADLMAKLADTLEDAGYPDHRRQVFLVRLLFCLFANDTGIFDSNAFDLLVHESAPDGKDLGPRLAEFFETLAPPREQRQNTSSKPSPACPTSTAASSPNRCPSPISTPPCVTPSSTPPASTGRASPPPSSARSSRASWNPAPAGRSARTTPPRPTSSRSSARSSSTTSTKNAARPAPTAPPSKNSTPSSPA